MIEKVMSLIPTAEDKAYNRGLMDGMERVTSRSEEVWVIQVRDDSEGNEWHHYAICRQKPTESQLKAAVESEFLDLNLEPPVLGEPYRDVDKSYVRYSWNVKDSIWYLEAEAYLSVVNDECP